MRRNFKQQLRITRTPVPERGAKKASPGGTAEKRHTGSDPAVRNYGDFICLFEKKAGIDTSQMTPKEVEKAAVGVGFPSPVVERITQKFIKFYYRDLVLTDLELKEMKKDLWLIEQLF